MSSLNNNGGTLSGRVSKEQSDSDGDIVFNRVHVCVIRLFFSSGIELIPAFGQKGGWCIRNASRTKILRREILNWRKSRYPP